jgi:hypothetical protein
VWSWDNASDVTAPTFTPERADCEDVVKETEVDHQPTASVPQIHFRFCLKSNTQMKPVSVPTQINPLAAITVGMPRFETPIAFKAFEALGEYTRFEIAFNCVHWKTSRSGRAGISCWIIVGGSFDNAEKCDECGECSLDNCELDVAVEFGCEAGFMREERKRDIVGRRNEAFMFGSAGRGEVNRSGENVVDGAEDGGSDNATPISACST